MTHLLAEGGYQIFSFSSSERIWLSLAIVASLASIGTGLLLMRGVLAADQGTATMKDIAKAIQEGAEAFLARQFKTILIIIVPAGRPHLLHGHQGHPHREPRRAAQQPLGHFIVRAGDGDRPHLRAGRLLPGALLPRRRLLLGSDRVRRHEPGRSGQRAHGGRRPRRAAGRRPCGSPSAPGPSPGCSASASASWVPPSSCSSSRTRPPRCSSASASAPRCSPCSCESVAASSPRRPT